MSFMTYEEIGKEIGITKQAVSQIIKKGINKTYNNILHNITETKNDYFEALMIMVSFFNIDNNDDFNQMYKLIDKNIKENIETSYEWKKEK
jgi:predicted transcriptional regulator